MSMGSEKSILVSHIETCPKQPPNDAGPKSRGSRKLSIWQLILCASFTLILLRLLHQPLIYGYGCVSDKICQKIMTVEHRARRILANHPLIDGHIDLPIVLRAAYHNHIDNKEWQESFENGTIFGEVDLFKLRQGQSGGAFWSVFAPCPEKGDDFSDANLASRVQYTLDQIDVMDRLMDIYPNVFAPRVNSHEARRAFNSGRFISPLGVEGLHQIGNSASNLRHFHKLGVRYATLTHNCHNKFADAAVLENPLRKAEPHWNGVSPLGRKLVHEMNRIGMIVDLSHVSEDTMFDVLGGRDDWLGSRAPVIFSHSSAYSICPHPRNVKDDILKLAQKRDSLVMVNINPEFISCRDTGNESGLPDVDLPNATLDRIVEHIMHIGNLIGFDHVGIGSDFDGIAEVPTGFEDVTNYPNLVAALLRAGISDRDAAKVVGENLLRVWHDVEAVSAQMKADNAPVIEDDVDLFALE